MSYITSSYAVILLLLCNHGTLPPNATLRISIAANAITGTIHIPHGATPVWFNPRADAVVFAAFIIDCASCLPLCFAGSGKVVISTTRFARINAPISPAPGLFVFSDAFIFFAALVTVRVLPGTPGIAMALTLLSGTPFSSSANSINVRAADVLASVPSVAAPIDGPVDIATSVVNAVVPSVAASANGIVDTMGFAVAAPVDGPVDIVTSVVNAVVLSVAAPANGLVDIVTTGFAVVIATGFSVGELIAEIGRAGLGRLAGDNSSRLLLKSAA